MQQGHIEAVIDAAARRHAGDLRRRRGPALPLAGGGDGAPAGPRRPRSEAALFEEEAVERGRERLLSRAARRAATCARASRPRACPRTDGGRSSSGSTRARCCRPKRSSPARPLFTAAELTDAAGGTAALLTRPRDAERAIRAAYREKHRLAAKIGPVQTAEQPGRVTVTVPIEEGPAARSRRSSTAASTLQRATLDTLSRIAVGGRIRPRGHERRLAEHPRPVPDARASPPSAW